jgi:hypothetical protein
VTGDPARPVPGTRFVAVDWSGARDEAAQRRHIWTATVEGGELTGLHAGCTRDETVEHLLGLGGGIPVVVGLDFSFGFPGWFAREHGCTDGPASWCLAAARGEKWLATCSAPFFGARGTTRPAGRELFRATERRVATEARLYPKSIFQLAGPGAVGPGSLRGMPLLTNLRSSGWAVWPFDAPGDRTVAEVYPALAVGRRDRASVATPEGRARFVDSIRPGTADRFPDLARSRDAFDAAAAAFLLAGAPGALAGTPAAPAAVPVSADRGLEGEIWAPAPVPANGSGGPSPRS